MAVLDGAYQSLFRPLMQVNVGVVDQRVDGLRVSLLGRKGQRMSSCPPTMSSGINRFTLGMSTSTPPSINRVTTATSPVLAARMRDSFNGVATIGFVIDRRMLFIDATGCSTGPGEHVDTRHVTRRHTSRHIPEHNR